ncbi:hypothetical protein, partial [Sinorhizobium sp. 6-117]|uniref:hypothetical protein n=1 Tax=Sinorhizobium sp. 6-117 TaxID=3049090 RepID=UPI0024C30D88
FIRRIRKSARLLGSVVAGLPHRIKIPSGRGQIPAENSLSRTTGRLRTAPDCVDVFARREQLLLQRGAPGAFARGFLISLVDDFVRNFLRLYRGIRCLIELSAHGLEVGPRSTELLRQGGAQLTLRLRFSASRFELPARGRQVVTGALEIERKDKRIGSSLEAAP